VQRDIKSSRFERIERLIGTEKNRKLQDSFIVIIGIGAVGGYAMEAIARSGVGNIRLVDFDTIEESNINRQLLAITSTIGKNKVETAAKRVKEINPDCNIEPLNRFFHIDSADKILGEGFGKNRPDLIIDAIDSVAPKSALLIEALKRDIPIVSSMGAALKTDPSQIKVADLMHSHNCPLARIMRKKVRQAGLNRGITCVYSTEKSDFIFEEPEERKEKKSDTEYGKGKIRKEKGRPRRVLGSLPTITAIFGFTAANIGIKLLTERTEEKI